LWNEAFADHRQHRERKHKASAGKINLDCGGKLEWDIPAEKERLRMD
jgi:hypothetical protein